MEKYILNFHDIATQQGVDILNPSTIDLKSFPNNEQLKNLKDYAKSLGLGWLNIIKPLVSYYGAKFDETTSNLLSIKNGFDDGKHFSHTTFRAEKQRVTIRSNIESPLTLDSNADNTYTLNCPSLNKSLYRFNKITEPESLCLTNLAYFSEGSPKKKNTSITINPIQLCPIHCTFCRREYDSRKEITKTHTDLDELKNYDPIEMARMLVEMFPVDWNSRMQISFVTGSFKNQRVMNDYLSSFANSLSDMTNKKFDPRSKKHQNIHIASHLATTEDDYLKLLKLGVKTYQNTIEIINDEIRKKNMPKVNQNATYIGKGDLSFDDVLNQVKAGIKIMGQDFYSGALILNLDTFKDTMMGITRLKASGLQLVDVQTFQPFNVGGISLYKQSSLELAMSYLITKGMFRQIKYNFPAIYNKPIKNA